MGWRVVERVLHAAARIATRVRVSWAMVEYRALNDPWWPWNWWATGSFRRRRRG